MAPSSTRPTLQARDTGTGSSFPAYPAPKAPRSNHRPEYRGDPACAPTHGPRNSTLVRAASVPRPRQRNAWRSIPGDARPGSATPLRYLLPRDARCPRERQNVPHAVQRGQPQSQRHRRRRKPYVLRRETCRPRSGSEPVPCNATPCPAQTASAHRAQRQRDQQRRHERGLQFHRPRPHPVPNP